MAILPVTLDNTFDQWRTKTNSLIVYAEQIEVKANAAFDKANAANVFVFNTALAANAYSRNVGLSGNVYTDFIYNNATVYANLVGLSANAHSNATGVSANAFATTYALSVGNISNNYSISVGAAGNAYAQAVGVSGNSRAALIGLSGNAYTQFVGQIANTNAGNAAYLTTGIVPSARLSGSYTGITGVGTLAAGTWQATPVGVQYGGTGGNNQETARTGLGLGALAIQNSVNGAQIVVGSDAQGDILYRNATEWARLPAGSSGQVLKTNGAGANPSWSNDITVGTAVATIAPGTSYDFTNIPAGVKRITIVFNNVSLSTTSDILVLIGDSSGVYTSGYISASSRIASGVSTAGSSVGFNINTSAAGDSFTGTMTLHNISGNIWISSSAGMYSDQVGCMVGGGRRELSSALTTVRIARGGTSGNFDTGSVNIYYE